MVTVAITVEAIFAVIYAAICAVISAAICAVIFLVICGAISRDYKCNFSRTLNRMLSCTPISACLTARLAADANFRNSLPLSFARLNKRIDLDCVVVLSC